MFGCLTKNLFQLSKPKFLYFVPIFFSFQFNNHFEFLLELVKTWHPGIFQGLGWDSYPGFRGLAEVIIDRSSPVEGISFCFLRAFCIIISHLDHVSGRIPLFLNHYVSLWLNRTVKYLKAKGIHVKKGKQKNLCFLVVICQKSIVTFESSVREAGRVADPAELVLIIC